MNGVSSDPQVTGLCRDAVDKLEAAENLKPADLQEQTDTAIRALVGLRDNVIEKMRAAEEVSKSEWKDFLDHVNIAISYAAAVEYPLTGIHKKMIEQAGGILKKWTG